ncbi:hypothetical protein [Devosia sp.]|uniref:hypothetical protein n=1 Tax=Devosia sp. TaxID=1871048 RepID=UPI003A9367D2
MSPSGYLRKILEREAVAVETEANLRLLEGRVHELCADWAGRHLLEIFPVGAVQKRTANIGGIAIDFAVALSPRTPHAVPVIYRSMESALQRAGYPTRRRNVSLAVDLDGTLVDLVPVKRESFTSEMHELYSVRRDTSMKSNLARNSRAIRDSGRLEEIRVLKLWRDKLGLDFPSFYLELSVLAALRGRPTGELADNVWVTFGYLEKHFFARAALDPSHAINLVSDELTRGQKLAIRDAAAAVRATRAWSDILA